MEPHNKSADRQYQKMKRCLKKFATSKATSRKYTADPFTKGKFKMGSPSCNNLPGPNKQSCPAKSPMVLKKVSSSPKVHKQMEHRTPKTTPNHKKYGLPNKITINVSGRRYQTYAHTLNRHKTSLLGSKKRSYYYDDECKEYYFDRDPDLFRFVLNYYRTGQLHYPKNECSEAYREELEFFGIPLNKIHTCCWEVYKEKTQECDLRLQEQNEVITNVSVMNIDDMGKLSFRRKMHVWLEDTENMLVARVLYYMTAFFIAVSVASTVIETISCSNNKELTCSESYPTLFLAIESVCVAVFSIEYLARFYSAPNRCVFLRGAMSLIDLVAILPFYVGLALKNDSDISSALVVLRVFRAFRIIKFSRHSKGLRVLGTTLQSCISELAFLLFSLTMTVIIFSTVIYYAERNVDKTKFTSIPASFWYTIVTMTTLGYGDMVPSTLIGKLVGSICSLSGVVVIALPVPVIVTSFSRIYTRNQRIECIRERSKKMSKEDGEACGNHIDERSIEPLLGNAADRIEIKENESMIMTPTPNHKKMNVEDYMEAPILVPNNSFVDGHIETQQPLKPEPWNNMAYPIDYDKDNIIPSVVVNSDQESTHNNRNHNNNDYILKIPQVKSPCSMGYYSGGSDVSYYQNLEDDQV